MELAKKMRKRDAATAPNVGDRVPYVIIKVGEAGCVAWSARGKGVGEAGGSRGGENVRQGGRGGSGHGNAYGDGCPFLTAAQGA